jgi:hypothetical protein
LTGKRPVSPALEGGVKGYNTKEVPHREATPFRAWSFASIPRSLKDWRPG